MRLIGLYQPYATLCVPGAKHFKTRCGRRNEKILDKDTVISSLSVTRLYPSRHRDFTRVKPLSRTSKVGSAINNNLSFDALIDTVGMVGFQTAKHGLDHRQIKPDGIESVHWNKYNFDDYRPDRFVWELGLSFQFDEPIPTSSSPGLWHFDLTC